MSDLTHVTHTKEFDLFTQNFLKMAYVLEKVSIDSFYGLNLLNLITVLEKNPRISKIAIERNEPCLPGEIVIWETMNDIKMPDDLKLFFLSNNGFKLTWCYRFGQEVLPVGLIHISNLKELAPVSYFAKNLTSGIIEQIGQKYFLHLGDDSKVFHLSNVDSDSRVCLVYTNMCADPTIWFADESQNWHFLSHNFMNYLRMAIVHVGLPCWQYCFTPEGVPSWVEQMILMEFPHLNHRRSFEVQHRKDLLSESKKKRKLNVINKNIFSQNIPNPNGKLEESFHKYGKRNSEKHIRR